MKNKSSLLISLFLLTSSILSLHGQVDSLRIELNKNPNSTDALIAITEIYLLTNLDSADYYVSRLKELTPSENQRVNTSMTIAEYYYQIYELDSALVYAKYVYDISENTSDNNLKLKALNKLIVLSELMGDFDTTQKHINTSIEIIPLADDFSAIVRIYTTIGTFFVYQNQYEKGLKYYLRVDSLYSQGVTPDRGLAIVYENIGSNYNSNLDPLAIQYYDKANEIYQNIGDEEGYNNSLMLKGEFYIRTKEYEKGLDNLEMSLDFFEGYGQAESLSLLYDALLLGYIKTNQSQKAQSIHEKRKTLIQSLDAPYILQPFHQISGEYFFSKGEYSQALNHFQESYDISSSFNEFFSLAEKEEALSGLKKTNALLGKWRKAYQLSETHQIIKDSLTQTRNYEKYQALESKFQNQKKTEEIALLKVNNELSAQRSRTLQIIYSSVTGLISLLAIALYFLYRNRQKTNERLKELDQFKQSLFTSISHEYRTPLTVIEGLSRRLLKNDNFEIEDLKSLNAIMNNSKRLKSLTNQIIDLNTIDAGKMNVEYVNGDMYRLLREYGNLFESFTSSKKQTMHLDIPDEVLRMDFDEEKIQTILYNLISNAYKFTPEGGNIYLSAHSKGQRLIITVKDDGVGIPSADLPHIFDRFFMSGQKVDNSSGIGLSLVKELVELMNGTVSCESQENEGATFTIHIPITDQSKTPAPMNLIEPFVQRNIKAEDHEQDAFSSLINRPKLLIVEDNSDIQFYLNTLLNSNFEIFSAENGKKGLEVLAEEDIDLIICDLMMPEMDGYEFSQNTKSDERSSHIPIIIISAKNQDQDKAKALSIGVDQYLVKPFSENELVSVISNVMHRRKGQIQFLSDVLDLTTSKKANDILQQKDIDLISNIQNLVLTDANIQTVTQMAEKVNYNTKSLQAKIKSLTGLTVNQYINEIRLKKAQDLLLNSELSVSEIAYEVCYKDPAYFSRIFKKQVGVSPKEFRE